MLKFKFLILFFPLLFVGCTSQESKIEDAVQEYALADFKTVLQDETASLLPDKSRLQAIYVRVMLEKSNVEVSDIQIAGDAAVATVTFSTIPEPIRFALRDIIGRTDSSRQDSFNVPNALGLVGGQMKPEKPFTETKSTVKLIKKDEWEVVAPPKAPAAK